MLEMHIERMHTKNNEPQDFSNIQYEEEIGEIDDENPNVEIYWLTCDIVLQKNIKINRL